MNLELVKVFLLAYKQFLMLLGFKIGSTKEHQQKSSLTTKEKS
jgi:hypothetical protein